MNVDLRIAEPPPVVNTADGLRTARQTETRIFSSTFHITINTNQRYGNRGAIQMDMRVFYKALTEVFGSTKEVEGVIEILKEEDKERKGEVLGNASTDIGMEYSPISGLHAHVLTTITHTSKIRIDVNSLWVELKKRLSHLNGKAPHIYVRFVPDQRSVVRNYIYKTVGGFKYKMREGMDWGKKECKCDCKIGDMSDFF